MPLSRVLGWVLSGTLIAAIVMMVSLTTGLGSGFMFLIRADWLILFCALIIIYGFASIGSAKTLEQARFPRLMQSGLIASLFSLAGCTLLILYSFRFSPVVSEVLAKGVAAGTIWSLWCGQFGALYRHRRATRALRMARGTTLALASVFSLALIWAVWWERFTWPPETDLLAMGLLALFTLVFVGALTCKLLLQTQALEGVEDGQFETRLHLRYAAICPRCEKLQYLMTGEGRCIACGLNISVVVP